MRKPGVIARFAGLKSYALAVAMSEDGDEEKKSEAVMKERCAVTAWPQTVTSRPH
jgi:hypothetical protein